jgi:hypothetical protein
MMTRTSLAVATTLAAATLGHGAAAQQSTVSVLERVLGGVDNLVSAGGTASVLANIASTNVDVLDPDGIAVLVGNIDGSIAIDLSNIGTNPFGQLTNTFEGIDDTFITRVGIDAITFDIGDVSSTVLGAVNTGDISLAGSVSRISETFDSRVSSAVAGLSGSVSEVTRDSFEATTGLLGDAANPVVMLNLADNVASIDGSIRITMESVNGTTGTISSTVLGAVNTGSITQDAATNVAGAVASVVGRGD